MIDTMPGVIALLVVFGAYPACVELRDWFRRNRAS